MIVSFFGGNKTTPWIACTLWFIVSCLAMPTRFRMDSAARNRKSSPRSISTAVTRFANLFAACKDWLASMVLVRSTISSAKRSFSHAIEPDEYPASSAAWRTLPPFSNRSSKNCSCWTVSSFFFWVWGSKFISNYLTTTAYCYVK